VTTPRTYTHTWTQTRLESIQDQFRYLLLYADISESHVDRVADGVAEEAIEAVGVYACDATGLRVVEVELKVDWSDHARLTLETPFIVSGLPGWKDHETPEMRVAGRRFAETVQEQELTTGWWIRLNGRIRQDSRRNEHWRTRLSMSGKSAPDWKGGGFEERTEKLLDLGESDVFIRRNRE
jgi:hypothetical protein